VENCRLRVAWERLSPQDVFKESLLFTQKNLAGVETLGETYLPHHESFRGRCLQILKETHSEQAIPELKECLQLAQDHPALFGSLAPQAKLYLSLFLSPSRAKSEIEQTVVYPDAGRTGPSREVFDLLLMAVKWQLKSGSREGYIKSCDEFIGTASKFFGEFHPVFSELYDVFSAYHQGAGEFEDAITFAKSSLVNVLKVCGTAHERTSECYYNLALCHIKAGRKEEAFAHINKARAIF
jgi:tetratricopeptide (TPR) repeat protein